MKVAEGNTIYKNVVITRKTYIVLCASVKLRLGTGTDYPTYAIKYAHKFMVETYDNLVTRCCFDLILVLFF